MVTVCQNQVLEPWLTVDLQVDGFADGLPDVVGGAAGVLALVAGLHAPEDERAVAEDLCVLGAAAAAGDGVGCLLAAARHGPGGGGLGHAGRLAVEPHHLALHRGLVLGLQPPAGRHCAARLHLDRGLATSRASNEGPQEQRRFVITEKDPTRAF